MTTLTHSPLLRSFPAPAAAAKSADSLRAWFANWRAARRQAREDRQLLAMAAIDPRVMTDLACAVSRYS